MGRAVPAGALDLVALDQQLLQPRALVGVEPARAVFFEHFEDLLRLLGDLVADDRDEALHEPLPLAPIEVA